MWKFKKEECLLSIILCFNNISSSNTHETQDENSFSAEYITTTNKHTAFSLKNGEKMTNMLKNEMKRMEVFVVVERF